MLTSIERVKSDIESLRSYTSTPGEGVTRLSFSQEDREARNYIINEMRAAGLQVYEDGIGTVIGRREGKDPSAGIVMIGSHFDTVRNGGAFDGAAGVVAAIEAARVLNEKGIQLSNTIEVAAMVEEEGTRFNSGMLSSSAMAGKIDERDLEILCDEEGVTLKEAIMSFGMMPDIERAKRKPGSIASFIELHAEQGPLLYDSGIDIGIVQSIVGINQYKVIIEGKAGHAGTTAMDSRSDALMAAAHLVIGINEAAVGVGDGTVATVGKLKALPGAANVIPGYVEFSVDIRSSKEENMKKVMEEVSHMSKKIEAEMKVKIGVEETFSCSPVRLSESINHMIQAEADTLKLSSIEMDSGAGHDAIFMAGITKAAMIFVPSKDGISHRPDEWTDYKDLQKGTELLLNTVLRLTDCKQY